MAFCYSSSRKWIQTEFRPRLAGVSVHVLFHVELGCVASFNTRTAAEAPAHGSRESKMEQSPLWWLERKKAPIWRGTWDGPWKWAGFGQLLTSGRRRSKWPRQMEQECCHQKACGKLVKPRAVLICMEYLVLLRSGVLKPFWGVEGGQGYVLLWQYGQAFVNCF